jgi:hypothetical protein
MHGERRSAANNREKPTEIEKRNNVCQETAPTSAISTESNASTRRARLARTGHTELEKGRRRLPEPANEPCSPCLRSPPPARGRARAAPAADLVGESRSNLQIVVARGRPRQATTTEGKDSATGAGEI